MSIDANWTHYVVSLLFHLQEVPAELHRSGMKLEAGPDEMICLYFGDFKWSVSRSHGLLVHLRVPKMLNS